MNCPDHNHNTTQPVPPPEFPELERYFVDIPAACPYGMPYTATYRQARVNGRADHHLGRFLAAGYRRNGSSIYTMRCRDCRACVPIRLRPERLVPNRNQRRTWRRNLSVTADLKPLQMQPEHLRLLQKFLDCRYPAKGSIAEEYYAFFFLNTMTETCELTYRLNGTLIGTAIIDLQPEWLNVVFFYFDPDFSRQSPGTFNILYLADFCRRQGIPLLYLGYWIESVKAMRYKAQFLPHEILAGSGWQPVDRNGSAV